MKRQRVSDGLTTWERVTVKLPLRKLKAKEIARARAIVDTMRAATPRARMASLRKLIEGCHATPAIKLHTDAIQTILSDLKPVQSGRAATTAQLDALDRAEWHWRNVLVIRDALPLAARGARDRRHKSSGAATVNEQRALALKPVRDAEATLAKAKWKVNKKLTNSDVARLIAPDNVDVVRQRIAKWNPKLKSR